MSALLRVSFNWNLKILGLAVLELPKSALNRQGIAFDSGGKIYSLRNLKISPFTIELLDNFFFKFFFLKIKFLKKKIWTKKIFLIIFWSKSWFLLKNGCAENCFQTWNTIFEVAKKMSPKFFSPRLIMYTLFSRSEHGQVWDWSWKVARVGRRPARAAFHDQSHTSPRAASRKKRKEKNSKPLIPECWVSKMILGPWQFPQNWFYFSIWYG